jgi:hypothetical protein
MLGLARAFVEQRVAAAEAVLPLDAVQRAGQARGKPLAYRGVIGIGAGQRAQFVEQCVVPDT